MNEKKKSKSTHNIIDECWISIKVYGVLAIHKGKIEMNDTNPKPTAQKPNR